MTTASDGDPGASKPSDSSRPPIPKFLDQAWQQYLAVRQTFVRDVSIAGVAVLLLTVTFFRSVELLEERNQLELKHALLGTEQGARSKAFADQHGKVENAIASSEDRLDEVVQNMSCVVNGQILGLQNVIADAFPEQANPRPREVPASSLACFDQIGAPHPNKSTFALTDEELHVLVAPENQGEKATEIVNRKVVNALNEELRSFKQEYFDSPILAQGQPLIEIIRGQRADLLEDGLGGEMTAMLYGMSWELESAFDAMAVLPLAIFSPTSAGESSATAAVETVLIWPYDENRDAETVGRMTAKIDSHVKAIKASIHDPESGILEKLTQVESVMGTAANARTGRSGSALTEIDQEIDALSDEYAEPLPGAVTLRPEDATKFFPLIVSIVLAYFSLRYLQIKERGAALSEEFMAYGLSEREIDLYLTGPARAAPTAKALGTLPARAIALGAIGIALLPGFLVTITAAAIIKSKPFSPENSWLYATYVFCAMLLVGTYGLLAAGHGMGRSPRTWMGGNPAIPSPAGPTGPVAASEGLPAHQQPLRSALITRGQAVLPMVIAIVVLGTALFTIWSTSEDLGQRLVVPPTPVAQLSEMATPALESPLQGATPPPEMAQQPAP